MLAGLEGTAAGGLVSQADMVTLAAAYAVRLTGGPVIRVPVGASLCLIVLSLPPDERSGKYMCFRYNCSHMLAIRLGWRSICWINNSEKIYKSMDDFPSTASFPCRHHAPYSY